jgi:hypothetical protein
MPFSQDLPRLVADDYAANGATAFFVSLFCQQDTDAHEVSVRQLLEKAVLDNLGKALGREMRDRVQNLFGNRSIFRNKGLHKTPFGTATLQALRDLESPFSESSAKKGRGTVRQI